MSATTPHTLTDASRKFRPFGFVAISGTTFLYMVVEVPIDGDSAAPRPKDVSLTLHSASSNLGSLYAAHFGEQILVLKSAPLPLKNDRSDIFDANLGKIKLAFAELIGLSHPNVVQHYHHQFLEGSGLIPPTLNTLMEICPGGDLSQYAKRLLPKLTVLFMPHAYMKDAAKQILTGLKYLHSKRVVHRDLKGANVFVSTLEDDPVFKIGDFGLMSKLIGEVTGKGDVDPNVGTLSFMSPDIVECLNKYDRTENGEYRTDTDGNRLLTTHAGRKLDVYSFGATMVELCQWGTLPSMQKADGSPFPPDKRDRDRAFRLLTSFYTEGGRVQLPPQLAASTDGQDRQLVRFLERALTYIQDERPDAATLLEDPYIALPEHI